MGHHVKRQHLIGDKPVPYELPCVVHSIDNDLNVAVVEVEMAATGMTKVMRVRADQVYFKLEIVK
jgi:hypothetical protein